MRFVLRTLSTFLLLAILARAESPEFFREKVRPLLENYCVNCHDGPNGKGEVDLAQFDSLAKLWRDPKLWERALVQLQDKMMPPAKKKQPSAEERALLTNWLQQTLAHPDPKQLPRDPGPAIIHRLSRLEYNRTVHDLLGSTATPADNFPPDAGGGAGFDNNAATLFVPPLLLEKFLAAADAVLATAKPELLYAVPDPRECIAKLATRAFRRPPAPDAIDRLVRVYEASRARGETHEEGIRLAAKAILVSPQFLFRIEQKPTGLGEPQPLDDYDLASRLSYFLWSSMPDAELFQLAGENKLKDPAILARQVERMLRDEKARTLAENFTTQWLRVKELRTAVAPAPDKFPQFTPALRDAFHQEPVAFFHALVKEDRPLTDFLDADYTFANETLARFYGLEGVQGSEMRRVALTDRRRGGMLGMGGILALTSYPRRTSPVLRGKWVMEEVLGTPPPPPPPNVDVQSVAHKRDGTLRQRLEQHRADPKCAGCHARMDPLGFGLENFGVIGEWRTEAEKQPIDSSGRLVDGQKFNGPIELKALLLARKDDFTRNVTEKMLAYALGRGLEPADWWPVQQIAKAVAADDYRTQRLILEIVRSYPFQYRRPQSAVAQQQP